MRTTTAHHQTSPQEQPGQSPFYDSLSELLQSQMPSSVAPSSLDDAAPCAPSIVSPTMPTSHLADLPNVGIVPKGGSAFLLGQNFLERRDGADDVAPFDSPFDQSLGSPASARDWGSPVFGEHEPALIAAHDHGTQDLDSGSGINADWLAGINLFADEWPQSLSQATVTAGQSQEQQQATFGGLTVPSSTVLDKPTSPQPAPVDFSFDSFLAATTGAAAADKAAAAAAMLPASTVMTPLMRTLSRSSSAASGMTVVSSVSSVQSAGSAAPSSASSSASEPSITQLAGVFLQEYARSHDVRDISTLVESLNRAGIQLPAELVYTLSRAQAPEESLVSQSPRPSPPLSSTSSPVSGYQSPVGSYAASEAAYSQHTPSLSPSPVHSHQQSPAYGYGQYASSDHFHDAAAVAKSRSSVQASHGTKSQVLGTSGAIAAIKANQAAYFTSHSRHGKRFTCAVCQKTFDRLFNLRSHAKTHIPVEERDTPFYCPIADCNKGFVRKHDTLRHYKTVHVKRGETATAAEVEAATSGRGRPSWDAHGEQQSNITG